MEKNSGKGDPIYHLCKYGTQMQLKKDSPILKCRFSLTIEWTSKAMVQQATIRINQELTTAETTLTKDICKERDGAIPNSKAKQHKAEGK